MQAKFGHTPKIYKYMSGSDAEERLIENNPGVEELMMPIKDGEKFDIDDMKLEVLETIGHCCDHCCFILQHDSN